MRADAEPLTFPPTQRPQNSKPSKQRREHMYAVPLVLAFATLQQRRHYTRRGGLGKLTANAVQTTQNEQHGSVESVVG